jgi:hypothetical protein
MRHSKGPSWLPIKKIPLINNQFNFNSFLFLVLFFLYFECKLQKILNTGGINFFIIISMYRKLYHNEHYIEI